MVWKKINNCLTVGAEDKTEISVVATTKASDNDVLQTIVGINETMDERSMYNVYHVSRNNDSLIYTLRAIPKDTPLVGYKVKTSINYAQRSGFNAWPYKLGATDESTFMSHNNFVTTAIVLMWTAIEKLSLTHYTINLRDMLITKRADGKDAAQLTCEFGRFKRNTLTITVEKPDDPS